MKHWNTPIEHLIHEQGTSSRTGLSSAEAASRLAAHGANAYQQAKGESVAAQVLRQFRDVSNVILLVAAALSLALAEIPGLVPDNDELDASADAAIARIDAYSVRVHSKK